MFEADSRNARWETAIVRTNHCATAWTLGLTVVGGLALRADDIIPIQHERAQNTVAEVRGSVVRIDMPPLQANAELLPLPARSPDASIEQPTFLEATPHTAEPFTPNVGPSIGPPQPRSSPRVYFPRLTARWHAITKPRLAWSHWGYPEQFIDPPLGATVAAPAQIQIANGQAAQMVLYDYDFFERGSQAATLNPSGHRKLDRISQWAESNPAPIIVERLTGNDELNEARRQYVIDELQKLPARIPEMRVVVGEPSVARLNGDEATAIYQSLLRRTQTGTGATPTSGSVSGGGMTPSSGSINSQTLGTSNQSSGS